MNHVNVFSFTYKQKTLNMPLLFSLYKYGNDWNNFLEINNCFKVVKT